MSSTKLSNTAQKPRLPRTLKQRAADARDVAERTIRREDANQVTDQPQSASLPASSAAEHGADVFQVAEPVSHDAGGGRPAASVRAPHREHEMGRHETFETSTPIAEELLAGTMLGRPVDDPALGAISAHRDAYAAWLPHLDATSEAMGGSPEWHTTHEAAAEPMRVETETYDRLIATSPTTLAGLRALAAYLPAAVGAAGITDADNDAMIALGTVSRAVLALIDSKTAQAVPDPVDWSDPPPGFMASPALAPDNFVRVPFGLELELERLHDISRAEFHRRTERLREYMGEDEARAREAEIRTDLFLSALTAAIDPDSAGGTALAALNTGDERAAAEGRVLASSAVYHDDGTVTYCDASGRAHRRPMAHWVSFVAMQMHARVSAEITRQVNTSDFSGDEMQEFDSYLRRELRSDALFALAFHPERAFAAAEAERYGNEPRTADDRRDGDAELRALAPAWNAARDLYALRTQEQIAVCDAADGIEARPSRDLPHEEWLRQVAGWRERIGVEDAEAASGEALDDLGDIEDKIAALPAATLAGLRLKALVAQRLDDIDVEWPSELGAGLVRDILAFVEAHARNRPEATLPPETAVAEGLGLGTMPVATLATTHDVAALFKSVAHAVACQPRCEMGGRGGPVHNAAGAFAHWVASTMTAVEDAALKAMRARAPADEHERDVRLQVLAEATVSNGDPEETRAFAAELLATVET